MTDRSDTTGGGRSSEGGAWIGTSAVARGLAQQIALAGREQSPVWISGEDGVDRDLVAHRIHQAASANGEFHAVDLAALPAELTRREIYGAEPGVFPQLNTLHRGAIERTGRGTLLLEGIDALAKEAQEELAESLTSGRFRRLGGQSELSVGCRLIASGSGPLEDLLRSGRVLRRLADRLSAVEIRIPPLRNRREDIPLIAAEALGEARREREARTGRPCGVRGFSSAAQQRLSSYNWPGNERELRGQIIAALAVAAGDLIQPEDLLLGWSATEGIPSFRDAKRAFEREYVTRLLRLCRGNISQAARLAQKDRKDFYDVMRRNSINPVDFRR